VLLAVVAVGAGGYVWWSGRNAAGGDGEPSATNPPVAPPAANPVPAATPQSLSVATQPPGTTATAAAPPPSQPPPATDRRVTTPRRESPRQPPARQAPPPVVQPPPQAPVEEQGFLTIDADPFGTVFVDGVNVGTTPLVQFGVKPGSHLLRIENPGYKTFTERVQVEAGNTIRKRYTLTPEG
jgi:serine/threonine-protein kinase